jgi:hypothetical protein
MSFIDIPNHAGSYVCTTTKVSTKTKVHCLDCRLASSFCSEMACRMYSATNIFKSNLCVDRNKNLDCKYFYPKENKQ